MKTAHDPRHLKRESLIKILYTQSFEGIKDISNQDAAKIIKNLKIIDSVIKKGAPEWPINQINKVDLAILRLSVFELIIVRDTPFKVVADEAVELAKKYGADSSPGFVNGVLGNIITSYKLNKNE